MVDLKKRLPEEDGATYINRICSDKDNLNLTWKDIAELINEELHYDYSESWYRKNYQSGMFDVQADCCDECFDDEDREDYEAQLNSKLHQIAMRKVEVSDLVASNSAMIRRMSREETIKDIAHDFAQTLAESKPLITPVNCNNVTTNKEGILLISDWHYGLICENYWNTFSPEICKQRITTLLAKTITAIKENRLQKLTVLDLSDLIAGRIHTQIRIESRFDVITQTMQVSEILAEFLSDLSLYCPVEFYSCLDNHSRLEPNKKESMDLESLTRIIPWFLKERLDSNKRVKIRSNKFGEDIITCEVLGHPVVAVHGHADSPMNALEKLSMMTNIKYELVCMAHRHHMFMEEQFESLVVSNGCLVGVDSHSKNMRLTSKPSQTLIIVTPENVLDSLKRILV